MVSMLFIFKRKYMAWPKTSWNRLDIVNNRFGDLIAIEPIRRDGSNIIWKCKCDCGNETECSSSRLRQGRKKSCGCHKRGEKHYHWSGHKNISGYYWRALRDGAKNRQIKFDITIKDGWDLFEKQNRKCALTNIDIWFDRNDEGIKQREQTASLDRINSDKDYTIDNIQWVHKNVNIMKMSMSQNDIIYWARKISENFKNVNITEPLP